MKRVKIRRTMLVREVTEWIVEVPDDVNVNVEIAEDFGEFDEKVLSEGIRTDEFYEGIDDDDLTLTVIP